MAARVSFLTKRMDAEAMKIPPKHVVPKSAVVDCGGNKVIFVVDQDKAHATKVVLGPAVGEGYELVDGPAPATRIVQTPASDLGGRPEGEREGEGRLMEEASESTTAAPDASDAKTKAIVELAGVGKTFFRGKEPIKVLEGIDLAIADGAFEALMGPIGVGKEHVAQPNCGPRPT